MTRELSKRCCIPMVVLISLACLTAFVSSSGAAMRFPDRPTSEIGSDSVEYHIGKSMNVGFVYHAHPLPRYSCLSSRRETP